mmetsp:Transcript_76431/g.166927  ORF Transcript_76431/g.166927 Transcript_76431/m.166927 type:complete len:269 (-) Transcript_76431:384-1190(-)
MLEVAPRGTGSGCCGAGEDCNFSTDLSNAAALPSRLAALCESLRRGSANSCKAASTRMTSVRSALSAKSSGLKPSCSRRAVRCSKVSTRAKISQMSSEARAPLFGSLMAVSSLRIDCSWATLVSMSLRSAALSSRGSKACRLLATLRRLSRISEVVSSVESDRACNLLERWEMCPSVSCRSCSLSCSTSARKESKGVTMADSSRSCVATRRCSCASERTRKLAREAACSSRFCVSLDTSRSMILRMLSGSPSEGGFRLVLPSPGRVPS